MRRLTLAALAVATLTTALPAPTDAQEARRRWERMCQIRAEKFDLVLPGAMHDNDLDMWIVVMREGLLDPLWEALGRGYVGDWAYYVFTDRGERTERAALGVSGYMLEQCGVYDHFGGAASLAEYVTARGLESSFDMPSVYITGPDGIEAISSERIIQRGDLLMIDWGVGFLTYELRPGTLISVELFAYTANPEWGGAKVRIPLEDNAVVTGRGVEWLYPATRRVLLIR